MCTDVTGQSWEQRWREGQRWDKRQEGEQVSMDMVFHFHGNKSITKSSPRRTLERGGGVGEEEGKVTRVRQIQAEDSLLHGNWVDFVLFPECEPRSGMAGRAALSNLSGKCNDRRGTGLQRGWE